MTVCSQCGHENPDDARFCAQCGNKLGDAAESAGEPVSSQAAVPPVTEEATSNLSNLRPANGEGPETTMLNAVGTTEPSLDEGAALTDDDRAAVNALPAGSALLVVQRGPNAGSRFLLDAEVTTAGRHPESDIFLDDVTVSRRHAEFRRTDTGTTVVDSGSLNGTYVNRDRIEEFALSSGDEVQIGKFRLVYYASSQGFAN